MSMGAIIKPDENGNWGTVNQGGVDQTAAFKDVSASWAASVNGDSATFTVLGYHSLSATITISAAATVTYLISNDGVSWAALRNVSESGASGSSVTTTNTIRLNLSGAKFFKWNVASNTGTVAIVGQVTLGAYNYQIPNTILASTDGQPTGTTLVNSGSYLYGFNGSTWDRLRVDANKYLQVASMTQSYITPNGDTIGTGATTGTHGAYGYMFNGSTYDRVRNNLVGTVLASAARTGTTNSADFINYNHRGIVLLLNVTAASGTGGLQVGLQFKDSISGTYRTIGNLPTAVTAVGMTTLTFYPGVDALNTSVSLNQSHVLAQQFRSSVTHGDSSSYTYSLSYQMIL